MSAYTREAVEALMPTTWDRTYCWGMVNEAAPPPDMPRSKGQKNQGNTLWAHLVDIRRAWDMASLTHLERRALVMHYGLAWPQKHVAKVEGVSSSTVNERLAVAVGKMMDALNGTDHYIDEPLTDDPE